MINLGKTIKRLLAVSLAAVIIISCFVLSAFAGDKTTVEYKSDSTWTAVIPDTIKAQDESETLNGDAYTVETENVVLGNGEKLVGTIEYSGNLTEGNVNLPYSIYNSDGSVVSSGSKIITQAADATSVKASFSFGAKLSEKAKYSGNYLGTATFNFSVAEKTYTLDEINADEHLYAIGKNKPEYVVAKFNEDYSSVKIIRNGDDSDGLMKDFQSAASSYKDMLPTTDDGSLNVSPSGDPSPMAEHFPFLQTATIEEGVKNIGAGAFIPMDLKYLTGQAEFPSDIEIPSNRGFGICSISIANTVEEIGDWAFFMDMALGTVPVDNPTSTKTFTITPITFPNSVKKIGQGCFYFDVYTLSSMGYPNVKIVNLNNGLENVGDGSFGDRNNSYGTILLSSDKALSVKHIDFGNTNKTEEVRNYLLSLGSQYPFFFPSTLKNIGYRAFCTDVFLGGYENDFVITGSVGEEAFCDTQFQGNSITIKGSISNGAFKKSYLDAKSLTIFGNVGSRAFFDSRPFSSINSSYYSSGVDITVNIEEGCASIGDEAFCTMPRGTSGSSTEDSYLASFTYNVKLPASLTKIGEGNYFCSNQTGFGVTFYVTSNSVAEKWVKDKMPQGTCVDNYFEENGFIFSKDKSTLIKCLENKLTEYSIPETVETIEKGAFKGCSKLKSVNIPNSVTSIGYGAFADCSGIESLTIPGSVKTIDTNIAFGDLSSLKEVTFEDGVEELSATNAPDDTGWHPSSGKKFVMTLTNAPITKITIPSSCTVIRINNMDNKGNPIKITVYGTAGSAAETWATENSCNFIAQ